MKRIAALLFGIACGVSAWAQTPAPAAPPMTLPLQQLVPGLGAPPDAGTAADLAEKLPPAPTDLKMRVGRVGGGKPTAGDVGVLTIKPPAGLGEGAKPLDAAKLESGPVDWGDGRILWWKPYDPQSGEITVGVTTYKPGPLTIRAIPFVKDGKPVFASQPKEVTFEKMGGDKSKDGIYEPSGLALPLWVLILLGLLSLAVVLGFLYWLHQWNKRRKAKIEELANAPRILNPLEEFEKVRRESEGRGHVDKGNYKPHYFSLSEAAKRFLGKAYRFDAEERTTRELLVELERLGMTVELLDQWERILDEMDIVKFTDQLPELEAARGIAGRLSQVVALSYGKSPFMRELLAQQQAAAQQASKASAPGARK